MILFKRNFRQKIGGYYKKSMRKFDYIWALLNEPRYKTIDISNIDMSHVVRNKRVKDIVEKQKNITLVLKPTSSLCKRLHKVFKYLKKEGYTIDEEFIVSNFPCLLDELYFGGHRIARYVVALYKTDIELQCKKGRVLVVHRDSETDLIKLKRDIRKITGFDFFVLTVNGIENFVGLNSVHIPDSENMLNETKIIRSYKQ